MAITRWDPFLRFPRIFEDLEEPFQKGLKIRETDSDIIAEAVVAGVPAKDVEVNIEDGVLTIKAKASEKTKKENEERYAQYDYYYSAALSGGQWDKAEAEIENGVVYITIPKAEAARPRRITVKEKKNN